MKLKKFVQDIVLSLNMMENYPTSTKSTIQLFTTCKSVCFYFRIAPSIHVDYNQYKIFSINFISKTIEVNQEYIIYDVTGFIGSIGGTLGLFIGFSFRDVLEAVLDFLQSFASRQRWF